MNKKRLYLFYIGHPAHYYTSISIADSLSKLGHNIIFTVRAKDVVMELVKDCPYKVVYFTKKERGSSRLAMILGILKREIKLFWLVARKRPFMLIGTDIVITHIGKIFSIPSIILNEDDEDVVPLLAKYGIKYSTATLSPNSCTIQNYVNKKIGYDGFHKMLYLTGESLNKRFSDTNKLYVLKRPYFLLRFSGLKAHHDVGISGINDLLAKKLINLLEKHGTVYLSSERPLPSHLESYRLLAQPSEMHYHLANAEMLISDSQSMSVEASILGTPSIRFSSFYGKIGVLEELEKKYGLTYGISANDESALFEKIHELLGVKDLKLVFSLKKKKMIQDKIKVLDFFVWFFDNYPQSLYTIKSDPNFQYNFK